MARYRKKPVEVEAVQYLGEENIKDIFLWFDEENDSRELIYLEIDELFIKTLEGDMKVSKGDYIIKGVQGEFYPIKESIFLKTYEKVEGVGDFIGDKKPVTQHCPTCEQLLAEVKRLEAELAEERRYWK